MKRIDPFLLITTIFLTFFGLFMIYDASSFVAFRDFGDKYHYLKEQSFWIILGFISLSFFTLFNYKKFYNLALPILVISLVFLLLVFIPGLGVSLLGARRWVNFGFILFQPSEFIKLALAIYLSAWFSNKEKGRLWSFLLLLGFIFSLIMLQPDMGTAVIILAEAFIIFFLSGGKISYFFFIAPVIAFLGYILINFAAQTALLPLTGVPLPLISYGGSALIMNLTAIGILLNIGRQGHNK